MNTIKNIIITYLFVGCLFVPTVAQETKTFSVNFNESDFNLNTDDNDNIIISSSKRLTAYSEDTSTPGLPYIPMNILIGSNQNYKNLTFSIDKKIKIKSNVIVAPNPEVCPTNVSATKDIIEYKAPFYKEAKYPITEVEYSGINKMDGYKILALNICPFIYDVKNKDLYLVKSLTINVSFDENKKISLAPHSNRTGAVMYNVVKDIIDNPNDLAHLYSSTKQINGLKSLGYTDDNVEYLLITNEKLAESFSPLVEWKKEKGVTAKIITTEYINNNYSGATMQLKIKTCLKEYYENNGLKYVLLGGDDTVVPVMGCYAKVPQSEEKYDVIENKMPTDLFYACFDNSFDWNANGNSLYGEIEDDIDIAPEVFISRVPVQNTNDTYDFVNKTINYEQFISTRGWENRILMCGVQTFKSGYINGNLVSDSQNKSEELYRMYIEDFWDGEKVRFYDTHTDFSGGADYDLNSVHLQEKLSQGYNFIHMMSHGDSKYFVLENDLYDISKASTLYNKVPTVIATTACHTNHFDNNTEPCLSEAFIRNENNGVIAYLGCSREGWGWPNIYFHGPSEDYNGLFYKSLFKNSPGSRNFGDVIAATKMAFLGKCKKEGAHRWIMFGLNPIGDPEMPIYTQTPNSFENITLKFDENKLIVDTGEEECRICVMSSNSGKSYYKVVSNTKTATFTNLCDGEIDICVTKEGYKPYRYISYIKFIQNETISKRVVYPYKNSVVIGSNVTDNKPLGPVTVEAGGSLRLKECEDVTIKGDFEVRQGAEFIIEQ